MSQNKRSIIEERNFISASGGLCLIWILYVRSCRFFFKILFNDSREIPRSWKRLQWDFYELLQTKFLTESTLSGQLAINFLSNLVFSAFLLRLFIVHVAWHLCTGKYIFFCFFCMIVKVKLPVKLYQYNFDYFFSLNKCLKIFLLSCPRQCDRGLMVVIVYYFQIWSQKEQNIIIISRVISSHMGSMYIETPIYIYIYIYNQVMLIAWKPSLSLSLSLSPSLSLLLSVSIIDRSWHILYITSGVRTGYIHVSPFWMDITGSLMD